MKIKNFIQFINENDQKLEITAELIKKNLVDDIIDDDISVNFDSVKNCYYVKFAPWGNAIDSIIKTIELLGWVILSKDTKKNLINIVWFK